jgi:uncharacterized protein YcfJ
MKKFVIAALAFAAIAASAQIVDPRGTYNYLPNAADRVPDGASGPGIVFTQRTTGTIISVGAPVYKNIAVGQVCNQAPQYQQQQNGSSLNMGSVIGGVAGAIIGNQVGGRGDGKTAATALGAVTGAFVGNNMNQQMNQQPQYQQPQYQQGQQCQTQFEPRLVGYPFTVQYQHLQMQGFMSRQPQVGETAEIIIRSTFYAAQ